MGSLPAKKGSRLMKLILELKVVSAPFLLDLEEGG